ncbi:DsbC family protein [Pseudomonas cedrina]|uniref:DsbC family protein n=1 Tax=Pseudomonas cedrina TaxID=651740 RepID=UPI00277D24E4|nr:DsbC family protein [Pseudomonas cedrina]MDQ0655232.1 TrbB protein [Pseudomonas cedrina]
MKSNDYVRVVEHSMLVHFGSTGESQTISTIDLASQGVSFCLQKGEKAITVQRHGSDVVQTIESFGTEQLASAGFAHLQHQLNRYAKKLRLTAWYKGAIKWVLSPLLAFILVVSLNAAVTAAVAPGVVPAGLPPVAIQHSDISPELAVASMASERRAAESLPTPAKPRPDSKLLANALRDGVAANKYSIQLSSGPKGDLYVFSDPLCPYCQRLETQLEKLTDDYTIHLFPVSVIGGDDSIQQLGPMLCSEANARAALWKQAISSSREKQPASCEQASEVLAANNEFFRAMLFEGTPVIINAQGREFPSNQRATAENITQWIATSAGANR